ncbi:MAG: hypothetical protein WCW31_03275 [Patescibacteria group bacterium]|jgi:hypothetical protein
MVREENVIQMRVSMMDILARRDREQARLMKNLFHHSQIFRDCVLNPMRDNLEMNTDTFMAGGVYLQNLQEAIERLAEANVKLPELPPDDFVETLEQALDRPGY